MAWDEDLLLLVLNPSTGRFRARTGTLAALVAAGAIAEAAAAGRLHETDGRCVAHSVSMDPAAPEAVAVSDAARAAKASGPGLHWRPVRLARRLPREAPSEAPERGDDTERTSTIVGALAGDGRPWPAALQLWAPTPVRTRRLIRRLRTPALGRALAGLQADGTLRVERRPRQRWGHSRWRLVDDVRRERLLAIVAEALDGDSSATENSLHGQALVALLTAADKIGVVLGRLDPERRSLARELAAGNWAARALRASLGLDPFRVHHAASSAHR